MGRNNQIRLSSSYIIALFVCLAALGLIFGGVKVADAAAATAANKKIDVTLTVNDKSAMTSTSLDRDYYAQGDEVVVSWHGATDGDNFIIPTSITYGNSTIDVAQLIKADLVQSTNTEYVRRMNQGATLCEFATLQNYVERTHSVSLGKLTSAANVIVNYEKVTPIYRLYNIISSEHLFTPSREDYDIFVLQGKYDSEWWIGEGISWLAPESGATVYRLYNKDLGAAGRSSHYYTTDLNEIELLKSQGWVVDSGGQEFNSGGNSPIWTAYNEALGSAHHYTTNNSEWSGLETNGWNIEQDKNGAGGVFSSVLGLGWSFESNYYFVEHKIGSETIDKQAVSANGSTISDATSLNYPGYGVASVQNIEVSTDNSSVAVATYEQQSFKLTFNKNGSGISSTVRSATYGQLINTPSTPNSNGQEFKGWTYDPQGLYTFDFTKTQILAGELTLYAKWEKVEENLTGKTFKVEFNFNLGNMASKTFEVQAGSLVGQPSFATEFKTNRVDETTGKTLYKRFGGWYTLPEGNDDKWDFTTPVNQNLTLYANWIEVWVDDTIS